MRLKQSIPRDWLQLLSNDDIVEDATYYESTRQLHLTENAIILNNSEIELEKLKTRDIYYQCLYPIKIPKFIESWETILETEISWKEIFKILDKTFQGNKQKQLHWKIIHRAIYSETKLAGMGKSNGICKLCNLELEDITHLFFRCRNIKNIWGDIESLILEKTGVKAKLDICNVLFGVNENVTKRLQSCYQFTYFRM